MPFCGEHQRGAGRPPARGQRGHSTRGYSKAQCRMAANAGAPMRRCLGGWCKQRPRPRLAKWAGGRAAGVVQDKTLPRQLHPTTLCSAAGVVLHQTPSRRLRPTTPSAAASVALHQTHPQQEATAIPQRSSWYKKWMMQTAPATRHDDGSWRVWAVDRRGHRSASTHAAGAVLRWRLAAEPIVRPHVALRAVVE